MTIFVIQEFFDRDQDFLFVILGLFYLFPLIDISNHVLLIFWAIISIKSINLPNGL